jgi:tetratricopeptide (TPR) repeat protein
MARKKKNKMAQPSDGTVVSPTYRSGWVSKRKILLVGAVVLLLVVGAGVYWYVRPNGNDKATDAAEQRTLQTSLSSAISASDNRSVIYTTTSLIDGAKAGRFTVSDNDLGWYYTDRANAYITLNQYKNAVPDFEQAAKLNYSLKLPALQGEFQARYNTGERQQLIPLLQQLIQLENASQDPMRGSTVQQYQADIQAIQHNQEISF